MLKKKEKEIVNNLFNLLIRLKSSLSLQNPCPYIPVPNCKLILSPAHTYRPQSAAQRIDRSYPNKHIPKNPFYSRINKHVTRCCSSLQYYLSPHIIYCCTLLLNLSITVSPPRRLPISTYYIHLLVRSLAHTTHTHPDVVSCCCVDPHR